MELLDYEESTAGIVKSWADKIPLDMMPEVDGILAYLSAKDAQHFKDWARIIEKAYNRMTYLVY